MRRSSAACVETDCGEGGGPPRRISAAGVETAAREAGHSGGLQLQASRPRRGRRASAADLGRRRRDRGEGGGPPRLNLAACVETAAREAGQRGGLRPPASRPWRRRRATAADLGRRRRDRGEGGRPQRRISAAGVETVAREAGHRCGPRPLPSRPWRKRLGTAADLGLLRRDRSTGGRPKRRSSAANVETVANQAFRFLGFLRVSIRFSA
jgi:hypothetical protein